MNILAIESSCDETAAAVVRDGRAILSSIVFSQIDIHKVYGGVVPEIASRCHVEKITPLVSKAISDSSLTVEDIDAVAVTSAPGLIGALLVGLNFAKGFAYANKLPLVPVHHIRSHIAANYLAYPELEPPFLAMVVSGGHSHIVKVDGYTDYKIIGMTRDDAAGEAFDKGARVLGLPYPGGVEIDRLSKSGNRHAVKFPRVSFKDAPFDFSFSGVKTAVVNFAHTAAQRGEKINAADIAASYSDAITDVLTDKFYGAAREYGAKQLVVAGGVSANSMLREKLEERLPHGCRLFVPPLSLCGDNAAMVGAQGYYEYRAGFIAELDQNAFATADIQDSLCKPKEEISF